MRTLRESRYRGTSFVASSTLEGEAKGWAIVPKKGFEAKGKGVAAWNTCVVAQTGVWADENKLEGPTGEGDTLLSCCYKAWSKPWSNICDLLRVKVKEIWPKKLSSTAFFNISSFAIRSWCSSSRCNLFDLWAVVKSCNRSATAVIAFSTSAVYRSVFYVSWWTQWTFYAKATYFSKPKRGAIKIAWLG